MTFQPAGATSRLFRRREAPDKRDPSDHEPFADIRRRWVFAGGAGGAQL